MSLHFSPPTEIKHLEIITDFCVSFDSVCGPRALLPNDLHLAIGREELFLHYQPVVNIESGVIECFEALLRWQHPLFGVIMPTEFIPIAEDLGLILAIGEWALLRACSDALSWNTAVRVAVNVSPIQIRDDDLVAAVGRALDASGLPPWRLELEVTETLPIENAARCRSLFSRLRHLGVDFVMDDFGSGYATFASFKKYTFKKVKIDRSLITRLIGDQVTRSIVEKLINIALVRDIDVVAEGVENELQLATLRAMSCSQAQGYLFSPPMPISHFLDTPGLSATVDQQGVCKPIFQPLDTRS